MNPQGAIIKSMLSVCVRVHLCVYIIGNYFRLDRFFLRKKRLNITLINTMTVTKEDKMLDEI